jgi:hydroxycarboxylate dehydrogenase B
MTVTIKAKALEAFVAEIFASAGCSTEEGGRIGRYLVSATLTRLCQQLARRRNAGRAVG